ncbi:ImmA/IrrE family metallo-endopeptidase, partial [Myxococcota bacterium]|nr:ImmA/IrrE family metallo-endopeptidase [Myxococcota bacterium]
NRPVKTINEIIKGKAAITPETAIQLERVFGAPASFWMNREARYREALARQAEWARLRSFNTWLRELPLADMKRWGWVLSRHDIGAQVEECLKFFGVADVDVWRREYLLPMAAFRAASTIEKHPGAVAAWLRQAQHEAEKISCAPFDHEKFEDAIIKLRGLCQLTNSKEMINAIVSECAPAGVAVVIVRTPKGCPAFGATRWLSPTKALMALSFRYLTNDVFWFSLFHEAAHILLHREHHPLIIEFKGLDDDKEKEADRFAADFLIPPSEAAHLNMLTSAKEIEAFAKRLNIAPGIVVGRLQHEKRITFDQFDSLKVRYKWVLEDADGA